MNISREGEVVDFQGFESQSFGGVIDVKPGEVTNNENFRSLSDKECRIIDSLRAQYKHNVLPEELINMIESWAEIPSEIHNILVNIISVHQ